MRSYLLLICILLSACTSAPSYKEYNEANISQLHIPDPDKKGIKQNRVHVRYTLLDTASLLHMGSFHHDTLIIETYDTLGSITRRDVMSFMCCIDIFSYDSLQILDSVDYFSDVGFVYKLKHLFNKSNKTLIQLVYLEKNINNKAKLELSDTGYFHFNKDGYLIHMLACDFYRYHDRHYCKRTYQYENGRLLHVDSRYVFPDSNDAALVLRNRYAADSEHTDYYYYQNGIIDSIVTYNYNSKISQVPYISKQFYNKKGLRYKSSQINDSLRYKYAYEYY